MTALVPGVALALVVGLIMGLLGAGGSILTVPIMVYILGLDAVTATAYSLFVVGATSVVGAIQYSRRGLVDLRAAIVFALPALLAVFAVRRFLLPAVPEQLAQLGDITLTKDGAILILFAIIMAASSFAMISGRRAANAIAVDLDSKGAIPAAAPSSPAPARGLLRPLVEGTVVGAVTGLVGAGGGFVIVPALVVWGGLSMPRAVGTSLTIIAAKSLVGFAGDLGMARDFDWILLMAFTGVAVVGIAAGAWFAPRISGALLRTGFGWFVLTAAVAILGAELLIRS